MKRRNRGDPTAFDVEAATADLNRARCAATPRWTRALRCRCCGSTRWAREMAAARPFASVEAMAAAPTPSGGRSTGRTGSRRLPRTRGSARRRVGRAGGQAGRRAGAGAAAWSAQEQARRAHARPSDVRERLARGKSRVRGALRLHFHRLRDRQDRPTRCWRLLERAVAARPDEELRIAAEEQRKITRLRLTKLLERANGDYDDYDTRARHRARRTGGGVTVILELRQASEWAPIGRGTTDEKGRVMTLDRRPRSRPAPTA